MPLPGDIRDSPTVAQTTQHNAACELRYSDYFFK